jgi:hypothetical protein
MIYIAMVAAVAMLMGVYVVYVIAYCSAILIYVDCRGIVSVLSEAILFCAVHVLTVVYKYVTMLP